MPLCSIRRALVASASATHPTLQGGSSLSTTTTPTLGIFAFTILLLLSALSCTQDSEPRLEPTRTLAPTPFVPPTQGSVSFDLVAATEYAISCRQLLDSGDDDDFRTGKEGEQDFYAWVDAITALIPPPELRDFHESWTTQFAGQSNLGPNAKTQQAAWQEAEIVVAMMPELRQILVDERCLTETEVLLYNRQVAARARLAAATVYRAQTVEEYVQVCADIKFAAPIMGGLSAMFTHLLTEWQNLVPPPGLEVYHSTVHSFYQELRSAKWDIDKVPGESLVALKSAVRAATDKHPDFPNLLIRSGCTG